MYYYFLARPACSIARGSLKELSNTYVILIRASKSLGNSHLVDVGKL
jgi:hypothetical protein